MRPPPHLCPLSGQRLATDALVDAPEVMERALEWCAVHQPDAAELFLRAPPEEPSAAECVFPNEHRGLEWEQVELWRMRLLVGSWVSLHTVTALASAIAFRGANGGFAPNFPLHNLGERYNSQPWRVLTCLFTAPNLLITCLTYAIQTMVLWALFKPLCRSAQRRKLALLTLAGCHGAFAAGVAFPAQPVASGMTLTSVMAAELAARNDSPTSAVLAALALAASVVLSIGPHAEIASHLAATVYYALLSVTGRWQGPSLAVVAVLFVGACVARALGASAPFLAPVFAPHVNLSIYHALRD